MPYAALNRVATSGTMRTGTPNVYLAGAWVASDWPATMEAAVRSGVAAARAVSV